MKVDLTGRNVLVTGASRGIGAAIACAMGEAGAGVALHYSRSKSQAETLASRIGENTETFPADLTRPEECEALWEMVTRRFGQIDILVNNAGLAISSPVRGATEAWIDDWDATQAVNLRATGLLCRAAILHFTSRGHEGRIINISSRAAFRGDQPEYLAYAASKAGVVALTRSIARGFGKAGITAFNVAPGFTRTDMAQDIIAEYGEDFAKSDIALGRMTEPADIAPMVVLLASGLADHATGSTIDFNAGSYVH